MTGKPLRMVLRAHEQDSAPSTGSQGVDQLAFGVGTGDRENVMRHCRDGGVDGINRMLGRGVQESLDQLVDIVVQRG
ncbi:Uncharacterised protein [Mycobacteroides abscessus subsp. massiliense]|nr:Uncharacterised protein [Mycobacteroides abscessus subsp. massiliense]